MSTKSATAIWTIFKVGVEFDILSGARRGLHKNGFLRGLSHSASCQVRPPRPDPATQALPLHIALSQSQTQTAPQWFPGLTVTLRYIRQANASCRAVVPTKSGFSGSNLILSFHPTEDNFWINMTFGPLEAMQNLV